MPGKMVVPKAAPGAFTGPLPAGAPAASGGSAATAPSASQQAMLDSVVTNNYNNDPAVKAAYVSNGLRAPAATVKEMDPNDALVLAASGHPTAVANGIAGTQNAGNAAAQSSLNAFNQQLMAQPGQSAVQQLAGAGPIGNTGFGLQGVAKPVAHAVTGAPTLGNGGVNTAGLYQQPGVTPLSAGQGQGALDAAGAALGAFNGQFAVPAAGQAMGPNGSTVHLGALPGATDRSLQTSQLDRVLGYNPATASAAEAQLQSAGVTNLGQSLALARSARGGPAAQAAALRQAQGEGAATMSQQARDMALLRAKEEDTAKERELTALGLGNDVTGAIRTADVTERGNDVAANVAELNAGAQQRGQDTDRAVAERNAGVTERGQTTAANTAMSQQQLDALLGQQQGAIIGREAGVNERGQTIGATTQMTLGTQQIQQARDAISASALSTAEQTEANILMTQASLGYQLTPEQQIQLAQLGKKDPTVGQKIGAIIQGAGAGALAGATMGPGGAAAGAAAGAAGGGFSSFG